MFEGTWYPKDLSEQISKMEFPKSYLGEKEVRAILVPHDRFQHCGKLIAETYSRVAHQPKRVFILSPDHNGVLKNRDIAICTNLGKNPAVKTLKKMWGEVGKSGADKEHGIMVQVPYIKHFFPKAEIVPIIVGQFQSDERMREIANVLKKLEGLFVISGNLTHFGKKHGFTDLINDTYEKTVEELDKEIFMAVEMLSLHLLLTCKSNFCGKYVFGLMMLIEPEGSVERVGYRKSIEKIGGPDDNCVSYGGGLLYCRGSCAPPAPPSVQGF